MVLTPLEANINQTTTPTVLHLTIKEWHYCSHRLLTRVFHTYVEPTTHFIQILHVDYVVSRDTTNRTAPSLSTWRDIESIMTPLSALSLAPGRYVMLVGHGVSINMQPLTASILYGYYWTVSLRTIFLATNCFWKCSITSWWGSSAHAIIWWLPWHNSTRWFRMLHCVVPP